MRALPCLADAARRVPGNAACVDAAPAESRVVAVATEDDVVPSVAVQGVSSTAAAHRVTASVAA